MCVVLLAALLLGTAAEKPPPPAPRKAIPSPQLKKRRTTPTPHLPMGPRGPERPKTAMA